MRFIVVGCKNELPVHYQEGEIVSGYNLKGQLLEVRYNNTTAYWYNHDILYNHTKK